MAAKDTGEIERTAEPVPGKDITDEIKTKAESWALVKWGLLDSTAATSSSTSVAGSSSPMPSGVAYEQDYEPTQTAPSMEAEVPHFGTFRIMGVRALQLADHIRSLGYHAQVHSPLDNSGAYIPMFVEAGLGQLGANGQLLSPHFGSRARLMLVTTDALVTYDKP